MKYYSRYERYISKAEKQNTPSKTGVVREPTTRERIEKFLQGNQETLMVKPGDFDFPPGSEIPNDYWDHTRSRGYDMFDAHADMRRAEAVLASLQNAQTEAEKAKKSSAEKIVEKVATDMSAKPDTADIGKPSNDPAGGLNG